MNSKLAKKLRKNSRKIANEKQTESTSSNLNLPSVIASMLEKKTLGTVVKITGNNDLEITAEITVLSIRKGDRSESYMNPRGDYDSPEIIDSIVKG